jgi:type III secretion system FlhB-like substrate exporter
MKKHLGEWAIMIFSVFVILTLPTLATAATFYVNALTGNDSANDCSAIGTPCKTITRAASVVPAGTSGAPNIISVAEGLYNGGNGESFPIIIADRYVSLTAAGSGTKTIDAGAPLALDVTAKGVSVSGFTFSNSTTGINITQGGFTINNNIFSDTVSIGVVAVISSPASASVDVAVEPVSFNNNQFSCSTIGVLLDTRLEFDGTTTGLTGTIGQVTATGNTFTNCLAGFLLNQLSIEGMATGTATIGAINISNNTFTNCTTGARFHTLYVRGMSNSTVTWDTIDVNGNTFTANSNGIQFDNWYLGVSSNSMINTALTVRNVSVSNNTFSDNTAYAINIDYFNLEHLYGTSTANLGNLVLHNNTIETDSAPASGDGIYIDDIGHITNIYDSTKVTTGTVTITDNTVESNDLALRVVSSGVSFIGTDGGTDTAEVIFGPTNISGNRLTSTNGKAAYLSFRHFGANQYALTKVDVGLLNIHNNEMIASNTALKFGYFYASGNNMNDEAQLNIAGLTLTNNRLTSSNSRGAVVYLERLGGSMYNNSKITIGPSTISGNTIATLGKAVLITLEEVAYEMFNSSSFSMSPWTIRNNTLNSDTAASLEISYDDESIGAYMENSSSATLPDWIVSGNKIDIKGDDEGIYYFTESNPYNNYNNAAVQFGSVLIDNNIFNENKDAGMDRAINFSIEVDSDSYDASTFSHGDITISNNTIYSVGNTGINLWYEYIGWSLYDANQITMGNVTIADNMVDTARNGISIDYDNLSSDYSAVVALGTLDITGNIVKNITRNGITVDIDAALGNNISGGTLNIDKTTISDNTVTAAISSPNSSGIWISGEKGPGVVFAASEVNNNTSTGFTIGIGTNDLPEASIRCNTVENNSESGLFFGSAGSFTAIYNNLVNNGLGLKINTGVISSVTAENNWWGDSKGPVACTSCNGINVGGGTVDYNPWLERLAGAQCRTAFPWDMFLPAFTGDRQK